MLCLADNSLNCLRVLYGPIIMQRNQFSSKFLTGQVVFSHSIPTKHKFRNGPKDETATAVGVPRFDVVDKLEVWVFICIEI